MTQQDKSSFAQSGRRTRKAMRATTGLALLSIGLVTGLGVAHAQVPAAQTGIANPGRVQEQLPRTELKATTMAPIDVQEAPAVNAPPGADKIRFTLNDLKLDGVTAYSQDELRSVYGASLGQNISLADVYAIAARLTNKYRNDGYILTQVVIPPQTIEGGDVRLQVVEGFVYSVNVTLEEGAPAEAESAMGLIREHAAKISSGYALNIRDLERQMLLINDLPGVSARGVLAPAKGQVGAADLTILIVRDPFEAYAGLDNYGTKFLGPIQLSGAASANSIFGHNERLTAQTVLAPDSGHPLELGYFAVNYMQPLSASGLKLDINASHTMTEPGYTLDEFDVKGKASFFSIGLNYPIIRSRLTSLYSGLTFDVRNVDTRNNIERTRKDRIRALRGSLRLEHLDNVLGAGLNVVDLEVARGLDLFGATDPRDVNVSRPEGDPTFTKLNVEIQRLQRVASQVNLLVGVRGQLSNDALLSSEEFGVGGMGYGRGYDSSEIIGDDGVASKIELQWNVPGQYGFLTSNQFYTFADVGRVWNNDPGARNLETDTASSVGLGLRTKFMLNTSIDMTVAKPLNRRVQTMKDDDPRFFMSVSQKF